MYRCRYILIESQWIVASALLATIGASLLLQPVSNFTMDGEADNWPQATSALTYLYLFFSVTGLAYGLAATIIGGCSYSFCLYVPEKKFLEFLVLKRLNQGPLQNIGLIAAKSGMSISAACILGVFLIFGWKKFVVCAPVMIIIMMLAFYRTNKIASAFREVSEDPTPEPKRSIRRKVMQALWLDTS
jgi:hypothetical protein